LYVILKGKNSSIVCPDGVTWFNPTGNSGMAKGGSGDILTGILTGLLASGYSPFEACILGTWLHGLAGDLAAVELTQEGMIASDLIDFIPLAWKQVAQKIILKINFKS
jgi:NAD(P)H-hydrate epimerase